MYTSSEHVMLHIGTSFFRNFYDNIGITIMLALAINEFRLVWRSPLLLGLLANYLAFSLVVVGGDIYQGMLMPFVLAAIVINVRNASLYLFLKLVLFVAISAPGLALLALRGVDLYVNADCRDPDSALATLNPGIENARHIVAPLKYYYLLEDRDRKLTTLSYLSVDRAEIFEGADVVISGERNDRELATMGYRQVAEFECNKKEMPFLPKSYYRRSIFDEVVYRR